MRKILKNTAILALTAMFALPAMAQLSGTGYYRIKNAQRTSDYISLANDKFNFTTCISTACGGLSKAYTSAGQARAMECVGKYLETDIHLVDDPDIIVPGSVIYAQKRNTNVNNHEYNLVGQGTSLLTLTAGTYPGSIKLQFYNNYITISPASGSGASTLYTASIELKAQNISMANLGTRYFVDNSGIFSINTSSSAQNAKWYIEPVTHFNVQPEVELNGKYYTTLKVAFAFTLSGQVEKAYAITANNGTLQYQEITGTIPAGTPVLLQCGSPNAADCQLIPTGAPIFTAPDNATTSSAPTADESSSYSGTNLLAGTYYCNTDGAMTFTTPSGTSSFNANHVTAATGKYVIGLNADGKLGFVPATGSNMPANKAWLTSAGLFPTLATPTIMPAGGNYDAAQTVTITAEEGVTIYYTTDGSEPSIASAVYTEPITVGEGTTTIKAIAVKSGLYNNSDVASAQYVIELPVTTFKGDVNGDGKITISDVSALIDYLLGNDVNPFIEANADVDGNETISIRDVSSLIDLLLNEQ